MWLGSRSPRSISGFAVAVVSALAGCHAMPVDRIAPAPNRPQSTLATASRAALLPATVAMEPPSEMSSIEPVTSAPASLTPTSTAAPEPTPILDAALRRARGLDDPPRPSAPGPIAPPAWPLPTAAITPAPSPAAEPPGPGPVAVIPSPEPAPEVAEAKAREPEPARPEDVWRDGVRQLVGLARARLDQSGGSIAASPWALRARVLAWLAEPDLDPDLGQREADGVRAVLRALDDGPAESTRRGDEVRSAVLALEDRAPLEFTDLRLCSEIRRFGDFEPFEPPVRKAGQQVALYCEVDGLRFEQTSAGFRTRMAAQFEILPEGGGPPILTRPLGTAEETCRRRRRDYFVAYRFFLPRTLPPGDYKIRLTGKDLSSDRSASREVSFAISRD